MLTDSELRVKDIYNLARFIEAQENTFEQACAELRRGHKTGHWMWFIFPQIAGLGFSETSQKFAIKSIEEAQAYLAHPILGLRLREICRIVTLIKRSSIHQIFGSPDDFKLKSSMTLFANASTDNDIFVEIITHYFGGEFDRQTLDLVKLPPSSPIHT